MNENIYQPEYVKRLFNSMSKTYEKVNYITSFGFSIRWRKQFLRSIIQTSRPIELIDLMTGMGETWGSIRKKYPNANISALDFSKGMLEYANKKNKKKFHSTINILYQNALQNVLPSNHFDVVICAFGLKTFDEDQIKIIAHETKRILKPGGSFSFIEVSEPENKILRMLYRFHLQKVVPFFGKIILGNPTEYKMLWKYTTSFKNSLNTLKAFKSVGLETKYETYFLGCATGVSGKKYK